MERSDSSDKMAICRDICCSLLMLLLGLFFCFPLATLAYFTYQTITGSRQFCTLWIDISGRFAIFLIFYYIASICGFLPLPQRYHLRSFLVPFNVWSLRSWSLLFRTMCFRIPSRSLITRLRKNVASVQESPETPLLQENNQERLYTTSPRRRHTTPIDIPYPESYIPPVFISNPEYTPVNETPQIIKSSNGSITSIDPSVGDFALPIMPGKSSKRHYISEASFKESESPGDRDRVESKYRKRFTEMKWPGEVASNGFLPPSDYQATIRERQIILTSDKKSTALTDDDRLEISRRRGVGSEIPEIHIKKNLEPIIDTKTLPTDRSIASERPLDNKYFELSDEERLVTTGQQEFRISGNEKPKVDTTDDRLKVLARNELHPETNDQPTVHKRNLYPSGASCSNQREAPSEYRSTEAQSKFPGAHNSNQKPRGVTASNEQEIPSELRSTEAQMNFPGTLGRNQQADREIAGFERERVVRSRNNRTSSHLLRFPWFIVRNSKGVSTRIKELRKQHMESAKLEMERDPETINGRQVYLDKLLSRPLLRSLRSRSVSQCQPPRNHENINLSAKSSFRMENSSGSARSSDRRIEVQPKTNSGASEGNVGLTANRYATQKQGRASMSFSHAMNLSRSLADRATRRRRQLPSLRFQVYERPRLQIQDKTEEKRSVKLGKYSKNDQKDSERRMTDEAGPSNSSKFEEDTKETVMVTLVTGETANESINRSQLDLRNKLTKQSRSHLNSEVSAAVEFNQSICTKTTDKNDKDIGESNVSTKPSEAVADKKPYVKIIIDSPLVTSESDSDSDPERSK